MGEKSALIVDDSAAARAALARMLRGHGLAVAEAVSAEDALEYLARHRPDVVFMDHMMPGMNGFEAVKVIKADAELATVPVVMYTSRSGEVYVGQARALGALDVLPKEVKPADLYRILRTLNLVPERREPPPPDAAASAAVDAPAPGMQTPEHIARATAAALELPGHLARLQEAVGLQLAALRHELRDHHRRLLTELHNAETSGKERRRGRRPVWPGLFFGAAAVFLLALDAYWTHALYRASHRPQLAAATVAPTPPSDRDAAPARAASTQAAPAAAAGDRTALLDALQWALNRDGAFAYDRRALGDAQLRVLRGLIMRLRAARFRGTVRLTVHFARFCLARDADGTLRPAPPATPVSACAQIGYARPHSADLAADQSLEFATFLTASPLLSGSGIRVQTRAAHDPDAPADDPAQQAAQTAGEWNHIARRRNRVVYRIIPAGRPAARAQSAPVTAGTADR